MSRKWHRSTRMSCTSRTGRETVVYESYVVNCISLVRLGVYYKWYDSYISLLRLGMYYKWYDSYESYEPYGS